MIHAFSCADVACPQQARGAAFNDGVRGRLGLRIVLVWTHNLGVLAVLRFPSHPLCLFGRLPSPRSER